MVTCCVCKNKFKHSCVDITANEVRTLNSGKGYDWTCVGCRALGKDLKELKALILKLQNDIKELKEGKNTNLNSQDWDFEEVISEISERQKRKNNIVIFNVPEPDQRKSTAEQKDLDGNVIKDIMGVVVPDLSNTNFKAYRLGFFTSSKIRPIKVIYENDHSVRKILKNSKQLKASRTFDKLIIAADRTKKQNEYFKKVKQELADRTNAGENCRIKYFNNIPKVVPLN